MPGTGKSDIGELQQELEDTAVNLDETSENLHRMVPGLRKIWDYMQEAMGDTHQDDVPTMEEVVTGAAQKLDECGDTVAECAKMVRELEANT